MTERRRNIGEVAVGAEAEAEVGVKSGQERRTSPRRTVDTVEVTKRAVDIGHGPSPLSVNTRAQRQAAVIVLVVVVVVDVITARGQGQDQGRRTSRPRRVVRRSKVNRPKARLQVNRNQRTKWLTSMWLK